MLEDLLSKTRSLESQATGMESTLTRTLPESSNFIRLKGRFPKPQRQLEKSNQCRNHGQAWPHQNGLCPARGQTCRKCGKPNDFAKVCFSNLNKTHGRNNRHRRPPQHNCIIE